MDLPQEQDSAFGAADITTFIVPFSPKHSVLPSQAPQLSFSHPSAFSFRFLRYTEALVWMNKTVLHN